MKPQLGWIKANLLKQTSGFALLDILIASVIIGITVLTIMSLNNVFATSAVNSKRTLQTLDLKTQVSGWLFDEPVCRLTLGGPTTKGGTPTAGIVQVMDPNLPTNIRLYNPTSPQTIFLDPANSTQNKFGDWTISSIQLEPLGAVTPPGPITARMTIQAVGNSTFFSIRSVQSIYFSVLLDPTYRIVSCFGLNYGTDANPVPICASNQALLSFGTHVSCVNVP